MAMVVRLENYRLVIPRWLPFSRSMSIHLAFVVWLRLYSAYYPVQMTDTTA